MAAQFAAQTGGLAAALVIDSSKVKDRQTIVGDDLMRNKMVFIDKQIENKIVADSLVRAKELDAMDLSEKYVRGSRLSYPVWNYDNPTIADYVDFLQNVNNTMYTNLLIEISIN